MRRALFPCAALLGALTALTPTDAGACGGCFHGIQQAESTQVTGHRMILSISPEQSTLYDQMEYAGAPESFAWVLPVKGLATVGLSSDALLATLDVLTGVTVLSPNIDCPPSNCSSGFAASATSSGSGGGGPGVTVVAQSVVGPFETVQLSSADPQALLDWLTSHNYVIPPEIEPIVEAYVDDGFDFLALKLVPGEDVQAMRPVRVTTPGASPVLPLRMVAAGAGVTTPITLWVVGEGRYEPSNFPSFEITEDQLVWSWDTQSSNYKDLRAAQFTASNGAAWLVEAGEPVSYYNIEYPLLDLVNYDPLNSGYGDASGEGAAEELTADLKTLFADIDTSSLWLTRLYGELSKQALATDLTVGAAASQAIVARQLVATATLGDAPTCPPDPCGGDAATSTGSSDSTGSTGSASGAGGAPASDADSTEVGGCALGGRSDVSAAALLALGGAAALALSRRRRQPR
jgi:hypothetical protein